MKSYLSLILVVFIASTSLAQTDNNSSEEYQSFLNPVSIRGNIGLHTGSLNTTNNKLIFKTGGSIAIILNHQLAIGAKGSGFVGSQNFKLNNTTYSTYGGYGGLLIEPILMPKKAIHVSIPVVIGAGEIQYFEDELGYRNWDHYHHEGFYNDFIFIEPGINLEANLTNFMRFGVSASYLMTNTITNSEFETTNIDGLSLEATLKFGWFK
jgi:hypothetical protein